MLETTAVPRTPLDLAGPDGLPCTLRVEDVVAVARGRRTVQPLHEDAREHRPLERAMQASADWVAEQVAAIESEDAQPIYGINTGFGALSGREVFRSAYQARVLSRNLLVSHATGTGEPLEEDVVRAGLLIRAHQLARGRSGVRIVLVNRLLGILSAGVYPIVPRMGSLGASGDLAPLAHLALILSRPPEPGPGDRRLPMDGWRGEAWLPAEGPGPELDHMSRDWQSGERRWWRRVPGDEALADLGGQLELQAKEGLALTNGATLSAALATLCLADAEALLDHAELALAMTLEATLGFRDPFLPALHAARPLVGQGASAARILAYVAGSELLDRADEDVDPERVPPQDPYSIRCGPPVIGAARDALAWLRQTVETEINSAVDNPLILLELPRAYKAVSGGNFHGAPLAYGLDLLKIVMADCASQSERRVFNLVSYQFRDPKKRDLSLPPFLIQAPEGLVGLNSGMMIPQYTAAALVSAAKTLAHPDSVDSIPSSANQEDHVSMSMNAGLHARQLLAHAEGVVAIELMVAAQAMTLRATQGEPGRGTAAALEAIRRHVPALVHDRSLAGDIEALRLAIRSGEILAAARAATGQGGEAGEPAPSALPIA